MNDLRKSKAEANGRAGARDKVTAVCTILRSILRDAIGSGAS